MSTQVEPKANFVKLQEYQRPTLADGDYTITVTQKVEIDKHVDIPAFTAPARSFTVAGARFDLKPTDVEAVFPPDGNVGDHSNVLPHVTLSRSTLPWERTGNAAPAQTAALPWLALLLFDEDQKPKPQMKTVADLIAPAKPGDAKFPVIEKESAQHLDDKLTVIDVPKSLLQAIMPTGEELSLLTHVRFATEADKRDLLGTETVVGEELAVVMANRLPQRGTTTIGPRTVHAPPFP